jgi:DNA-directed RNA polymerase III subunit RPC1
VYVLIRDNSPSVAARCLHRLTKMCTRWLTNWGFSIGIEDVAPSEPVSRRKAGMIAEGYRTADARISEYRQGSLSLLPGCNEEQSLESVLNGILSKVRGAPCRGRGRCVIRVRSPRACTTHALSHCVLRPAPRPSRPHPQLRDSIGSMCMEELPLNNSPRIMATCGSKGSVLNICQMVRSSGSAAQAAGGAWRC